MQLKACKMVGDVRLLSASPRRKVSTASLQDRRARMSESKVHQVALGGEPCLSMHQREDKLARRAKSV